jgi:hypothetical protein
LQDIVAKAILDSLDRVVGGWPHFALFWLSPPKHAGAASASAAELRRERGGTGNETIHRRLVFNVP